MSEDAGPSFPPVTDFAAAGSFATTEEEGGASCTIFRPSTLGQDGLRHPVIIWGNGCCGGPSIPPVTARYAPIMTHWASHGFIVAAANTPEADVASGIGMLACLDWVLAENTRVGSPYQGHVDRNRVGASGHSAGGGGALMAGRDPRVGVTAPLAPYTGQGFGGFDQACESQQNGPMFMVSGGADAISGPAMNQQPVFNVSNVPTFWGTLADLGGTTDRFVPDRGRFLGPVTAWFRLNLMGDESARSVFFGACCGLCTDSEWVVQRKNGIQ